MLQYNIRMSKFTMNPRSPPFRPRRAAPKKAPRRKPVKKAGLNKVEKKQVKTLIASRKEKKYCKYWINYDYYDPTQYTQYQLAPIIGNVVLPNVYDSAIATTTIVGLQTGQYLNTMSTNFDSLLTAAGQGPCMNPLGGFQMREGDSAKDLDGDYAYFNSGCINLQLNSLVAEGNIATVAASVSPLCFRILHVRAKKDAAGITPSVAGDLFRTMTNENAGFMSDMTLRQLTDDYGLNRDRFEIKHDIKFKLSQPVQPDYGGTTANQGVRNLPYPTQKRIKLWLDKPKKKLRFSHTDNGTNNSHEPLNYDFVNYVFVICSREQVPGAPTGNSFSSTAKMWSLTTQGQTTYRDC